MESAHGIRLRLRDRDGEPREVVDAMASWWCAIHGYAVPELDAAAHRQLGSMAHVMFGGLTHEPAVGLAAPAGRPGPRRPRARVPRRLGLGVGRGRDEDGAAVAPRGRAAAHPVLHDPRRLPRRHVLADVGDRPGRRDALAVPRGAARARLRAATAGWPRPRPGRPRAGRLGARDPGPVRRARRRRGRRHRRAGAAGRRRHARLQPARAGGAARAGPRARRAGHPRRDRHRVPPHRAALGRRRAGQHRPVGRSCPGHPLRRQGPDRRLPHPRRRALHPRGGRGGQRRRGRWADARPHLHGQPAGLRHRVGEPRPAGVARHRGRGGPHRTRADRGSGAGGIPDLRRARCACWEPSASCSCASRCGWPR